MIDIARTKIKLSDNWKWARCGEVIDVRDGTHDTPKYVTSGYPLITSKNLKTEGIDFSNVSYICKEDHYEISKRSKVDRGDILFAMIGTIGNPVIVDVDSKFSIKNVALFKFSKSPIDAKYFKYLLETPIITEQLNSEQRGGTQKFVSLNVLRNIVIPYPPIEEQRRIAAILDKADTVRRKRQSAIALTEELLRSAFLEMFGDPVTNSKGWETVQMSQVVSQTQYGTAEKANSEKNGIPVLRMNNITYTGEFKLDDLKWCPILAADEAKFTVQRGDLLFNRTNSPELVGKTAVWRSNEKYAFAGYLVRVRFKADQALSEYISAYLNSSHGKKYLLERAKPSINMSNFSASEFLKIPILLPPLALQERFVVIADSTRSYISRFESMVKDANDLFNSLLQKAFRGEL